MGGARLTLHRPPTLHRTTHVASDQSHAMTNPSAAALSRHGDDPRRYHASRCRDDTKSEPRDEPGVATREEPCMFSRGLGVLFCAPYPIATSDEG